jgi:hypothetical protein
MGKNETLEQVAERIVIESNVPYDFSNELIKIAKWQKEIFINLVDEYLKMMLDERTHKDYKEMNFNQWLETFKK